MKTSFFGWAMGIVAVSALVACGDDTGTGTGGGGQGGDGQGGATTATTTTTGDTTTTTTGDTTTTTTTGGEGGSGGQGGGTGGSSPCEQVTLEGAEFDPNNGGFLGTLTPNFGGPEDDLGLVFFPNEEHDVDLASQTDINTATDGVLAGEDFDPEVGVTGSLFFQSEGALSVSADGWSLTGVRLVELDEAGAPLDGGRCLDLADVSGDVIEPFGWLCDPAYYDAADGCDCECGLVDPDCEIPDATVYGCLEGQTCNAQAECEGVPTAWECGDAAWDDGATCDCACGVSDPDCDDAGNPVTGCDVDGSTCVQDTCVTPTEEDLCVDLLDNDQDNSIDCAEGDDCQGTAECTPGATARDGACDAHSDCDTAAGNDPLCITSAFGVPVPFCSEWCDIAANDCGAGALCLDLGLNEGVCLTECDPDASDCAEGFECTQLDEAGTQFGCLTVPPPPPVEWVCNDAYYGAADGCDCGCGAVDPDCDSALVASCEFCGAESCANDGSQFGCATVEINPVDNSQCL